MKQNFELNESSEHAFNEKFEYSVLYQARTVNSVPKF